MHLPSLVLHATELVSLGLVAALLVVPKILQRFRIPAPLTALGFGMAAGLAVQGLGGLQRRIVSHEDARSSLRVSVALAPTLIFTPVLAGILRDRYGIPDVLCGALLVYACASTALPSFLRGRTVDFDPARVG